jgi:hypothetical protein
VKEKSTRAKMAPISAAASPVAIEQSLSRRSTGQMASRTSTFARQGSWGPGSAPSTSQPTQLHMTIPETNVAEDGPETTSPTSLTSPTTPVTPVTPVWRRTSSLSQSVAELFARVSISRGRDTGDQDIELGRRESQDSNPLGFNLEDNLDFEDFQRMNSWSEELQQSLLAIEQNQSVLKQLQDHYREIIKSHGFTTNINKESVSTSLESFSKRIDGIIRDLDIYHKHLKAVARTLEDDKALVSS